ncbi:unnamed protein product [Ixodes persulcatus]
MKCTAISNRRCCAAQAHKLQPSVTNISSFIIKYRKVTLAPCNTYIGSPIYIVHNSHRPSDVTPFSTGSAAIAVSPETNSQSTEMKYGKCCLTPDLSNVTGHQLQVGSQFAKIACNNFNLLRIVF